MRSRISGSTLRRLLGADTLRTVLRCSVCSGGSMAMNETTRRSGSSASGSRRTPRLMPGADENVFQSPSTSWTSSYFVIDQYRPAVSSSLKCTGSSARSRAKWSCHRSSLNRCGLAGLMSSIARSAAAGTPAPVSAISISGVRMLAMRPIPSSVVSVVSVMVLPLVFPVVVCSTDCLAAGLHVQDSTSVRPSTDQLDKCDHARSDTIRRCSSRIILVFVLPTFRHRSNGWTV